MNWKRIGLWLKTAEWVASDRRAYGRDAGNAGTAKSRFDGFQYKPMAELLAVWNGAMA